jgi:hypothetical protein
MNQTTPFRPSLHGWRFVNRFASTPFGALGFCGGMCFGALDRYHAGAPIPPDREAPKPMSPLFRELAGRQLATLKGGMWLDTYRWQLLPDHDQGGRPGIGTRTAAEWPRIRAEIDAGRPVVLCLIRVGGTFGNVFHNHQVVACGYDHDAARQVATIRVYDPNHPNRPDDHPVTLTLHLAHPAADWSASQSTGERVRGVFVVPYDRAS